MNFNNAPIKYARPYIGQPFQREEQDGKWDFGQIIGVKSVNVARPVLDKDGKPVLDDAGKPVMQDVEVSWQAHLSTGFREFRTVVAHDLTYTSTNDWHPVPAEKVDEARAAITARIEAIYERLLAVEKKVDALAPAAPPAAPSRPSRQPGP